MMQCEMGGAKATRNCKADPAATCRELNGSDGRGGGSALFETCSVGVFVG
jgi:hypothetical protein